MDTGDFREFIYHHNEGYRWLELESNDEEMNAEERRVAKVGQLSHRHRNP